MKKIIKTLFIVALFVSLSSCGTFKKMKDKVSLSDVKKVADLIDMDFGSGPDGPFDTSTITSKNPKLVIQNDTDRTIKVKASGGSKKTFVVKSGKSKSATVKSGKYHFVATAKGTKGCKGDVTLKSFKQYKWVFIIRKR